MIRIGRFIQKVALYFLNGICTDPINEYIKKNFNINVNAQSNAALLFGRVHDFSREKKEPFAMVVLLSDSADLIKM